MEPAIIVPTGCVFVYGTLQRGHCRASLWPVSPLRVEPATTRGALYDVGPFPALVPGRDRVAGEIWYVDPCHWDRTIAVLDRMEGCCFRDDDLYRRQVVRCRSASGIVRAYAYRWWDPDRRLTGATRIRPGTDGLCRWRPRAVQ